MKSNKMIEVGDRFTVFNLDEIHIAKTISSDSVQSEDGKEYALWDVWHYLQDNDSVVG